jgi:hypothetical protein
VRLPRGDKETQIKEKPPAVEWGSSLSLPVLTEPSGAVTLNNDRPPESAITNVNRSFIKMAMTTAGGSGKGEFGRQYSARMTFTGPCMYIHTFGNAKQYRNCPRRRKKAKLGNTHEEVHSELFGPASDTRNDSSPKLVQP